MITTMSEKGRKSDTWKLSDRFQEELDIKPWILLPQFIEYIDQDIIFWKPSKKHRIWSTSVDNCYLD